MECKERSVIYSSVVEIIIIIIIIIIKTYKHERSIERLVVHEASL